MRITNELIMLETVILLTTADQKYVDFHWVLSTAKWHKIERWKKKPAKPFLQTLTIMRQIKLTRNKPLVILIIYFVSTSAAPKIFTLIQNRRSLSES
jgi:hypothetical protein